MRQLRAQVAQLRFEVLNAVQKRNYQRDLLWLEFKADAEAAYRANGDQAFSLKYPLR